jgi:hypothetical protein
MIRVEGKTWTMDAANMTARQYEAWLHTSLEFWALSVESWTVATMRLVRIAAGGPAATCEAHLMIAEKIAAATELQSKLAASMMFATPLGTANRTVRHYRGKVASNRRRLSR